MDIFFLKLVNMSITASWLVFAVIAVRLVFRKTPKWILCLLWGLVAVRLICPFSIESALSLIPSAEPLPQEIIYTAKPQLQSGIVIIDNTVNPMLESSMTPIEPVSANPTQIWSFILSQIWILGMVLMLLYTIISYLLLKRKVATAIPLDKGIKQSEYVDSPFVLGLIRPVIYLPFGMAEGDMSYVIAHEKAHIRRRDHWWKPFGFLLLSIYWFNPVLWMAYILLCRDIEAACDEKVIKDMKLDDRRAYSTALLNCSIHRRRIAACPLAFGETGVKARVKGIMNYRKPAFWIILIAMVTCIIISVCFLTDPTGMHLYEIDDSRNYSDLFTNTEDITLIREGEEYPVPYPENVLSILDDITVRKQSVDRSRDENRDKTNQIHLSKNTYLNFSHNFKQVWIDNGVKPTYTYRVNKPEAVRDIFEIISGERLNVTATDATSAGMTAVYSPKKVYNSKDLLFHNNYWLERANGREWVKIDMLPEVGVGKINVSMDIKNHELHDLDWSVVYGTLSKGTYRIGVTFTFENILNGQSLTHDLYGEFTVEDNRKVIPWFDEEYNSGLTYPRSTSNIVIPETDAKLVFRMDSGHSSQEEILLQTESGVETVLAGHGIRNVYLTDLTGDGIPEACVTLYDYEPVYNNYIAVYDYVENTVHKLESPGELQYELTIRNDNLIATMQKEELGSILQIGTLELVPDNSDDGYTLKIVPLDVSFREMMESITCIDIYTRKIVCLSSPEEIKTMASLLRNLQGKVEPVTMEELEPILADDFNLGFLLVNYELGAKKLSCSMDFKYIWKDGTEGGYRITEPEALRSFVEKVTDGVRNKKTSGEPFATMDTPWDWCAGLNVDAIASANMNVKLYTIGNKTSYTGGTLSRSTLENLISVLNNIPESSIQYIPTMVPKGYSDITRVEDQVGAAIMLTDPVNQMLVVLRTNGEHIEMFTTDDLEKANDEYRYEYIDSLKMWTVESPELMELMKVYSEDPPVITYTVGSEYDWQPSVKFTAGDFKLTLWLIEGWEYEEYSDRNSSGIRCRPADVEEGWIYFSYWPNEYKPVEEDRYYFDGFYNDRLHRVSYPGSVSNETGIDTRHAIWSYQYDDLVDGDYAVINDGADSWFLEYEDQISDIITISIAIEE